MKINRMRILRLSKGLTQEQLALSAQVSQSTISNLENGRKNITYDKLKRIAEILEVSSVDELILMLGDVTDEMEDKCAKNIGGRVADSRD